MKRILTASLHHESNTFNPIITGRDDFSIQYGEEIFSILNTKDSISGVVDTLRNAGHEVIPTVCARAVPNGEISADLYNELKKEILKRAEKAKEDGPVDALCLSLHGSMRIEGIGEAEGDILEALRELFPHQPLFAALDMHTTFTNRMFKNADGYAGYKCAPHTDCYETGQLAAEMTLNALKTGEKPVSAWVKIPFLVAGEKSETTTEPMKSLTEELRKCESKPGILAASYLMGFPWADGPDSGVSVLVVAEKDAVLAEKEALRLTELFWAQRESFTFHTETYPPLEALDTAFKAVDEGPTPIYLSDSGDNPTAGSSADCTNFLQQVLKDKRTGTLPHPIIYGGFYDPDAVVACMGKRGQSVELTLGAAFDTETTKPVKLIGRVLKTISSWGNYESDIVLFSAGNVDMVLTGKHIGFIDPQMFRDLGAQPEEAEIVVCKLGYLTAPQRAVAKHSIMALTEGSSNENLEGLPYKLVPRPLYPLDRDFDYDPKENIKITLSTL